MDTAGLTYMLNLAGHALAQAQERIEQLEAQVAQIQHAPAPGERPAE